MTLILKQKSKQGTSENLGRKISLHGSLFIMQNPPQHIRDAHEHIDFTKFSSAEKRCLLQVNMYGASDESRQSAFHMGSVQGQRQARFHGPVNLNLQFYLANLGINLNLTEPGTAKLIAQTSS
jgi:hypothetical protein